MRLLIPAILLQVSVSLSANITPTSKTSKIPNIGISPLSDESSSSSSEELTDEDTEDNVPIQCSNPDFQISKIEQLEQLYECDDIVGSVHITNFEGPIIDTKSIKTISGDFVIANASNLVRINLPNIASVSGTLGLDRLTSLTSVIAPHLSHVGTINWKVLPILSTVSFDDGIKSIRSITISDTSLIGFSGFDIDYLDTLNINNNRFLESISTNLKGIREKLSISANARNILVSLPQLEWANNITIRDVSSLNLSNVESVNASLEIIDNNFENLKFPNLKNVGGTLSIIQNYNLKDVDFPSVTDIGGGLMIVNNTNINKINFFPKLTTVGGAVEFVGDFKDAVFSKLRLVRGSALLKSDSGALDCSRWTHGSTEFGAIIRGGKISCTSGDKQQVIKYDQDGEIVDEKISIIDDKTDAKRKETKIGNGGVLKASINVSLAMLYILMMLCQY